MLRGLVIVLCAAGCLREPTFNGPRDADPDGVSIDAANPLCAAPAPNQVSVTPVAGAVRVCGPNYHFEFSNLGAHFPFQMDIAGTALMADGMRCNDERAIGIGLYPTLKINGEQNGGTGTMSIELGSATDAIAKVALDWTATYNCNAGGTGNLGTRSTFTFFPDGRVHRFDRFAHPASVASGACSVCQSGTEADPFYLTSYTTVAADMGGVQLFGAMGGDHTALNTQGASILGGADTCLTTRQRHIAFAWRNLNNTQPSSNTRVRVARLPQTGQSGAFAFVYDQLNAQSNITSTTADVLLHTTMLLGDQSTSCATLLNRTPEYAAVAPGLNYARMGDGPQPMGYGLDGIYGGEQIGKPNRGQDIPGAAGVPIILSNGPVALSPFAVWLELAVFHDDFALTRSFGTGTTWYRFQRASGINGQTQVIIWFPEGMPANQTITIDPI